MPDINTTFIRTAMPQLTFLRDEIDRLRARLAEALDLLDGDRHEEDCDVELFTEVAPNVKCSCWFGEVRAALRGATEADRD